jgi:hypothetical protein
LTNDRRAAPLIPTQPAFFPRLFAGIIDLMILAVPLSMFISFLSVALGISTAFLDLNPSQTPREILLRLGDRFIYATLAFFVATSCGIRKFAVAGDTGEAAVGPEGER